MMLSARQSPTMSFVEAITNVGIGFLLAILTQCVVFPLMGVQVSVADNIVIGAVFTAVSIVRTFTLRRLFEGIRTRKYHRHPSQLGQFYSQTSGVDFVAHRQHFIEIRPDHSTPACATKPRQ
jgi:hypothetical protein